MKGAVLFFCFLLFVFLSFETYQAQEVDRAVLTVSVKSQITDLTDLFLITLNCGKYGDFNYNLFPGGSDYFVVESNVNLTCRIVPNLTEEQSLIYSAILGDDQGGSNGYVAGSPAKEFNGKSIWVEIIKKESEISSSSATISSMNTSSTLSLGTSNTSDSSSSLTSSMTSSVSSVFTITTTSKKADSTVATSSSKSTKTSVSSSKISVSKYSSTIQSSKNELKEIQAVVVSQQSMSETSVSSQVASSSESSSESSELSTEEYVVALANHVDTNIEKRSSNYLLLGSVIIILILSTSYLFYYLRKNYPLLNFKYSETKVYDV